MSNAARKAIQRAKEKRERKLAQWWENVMKDPAKRAKVETNRIRFAEEFAKSEPMTFPEIPQDT